MISFWVTMPLSAFLAYERYRQGDFGFAALFSCAVGICLGAILQHRVDKQDCEREHT